MPGRGRAKAKAVGAVAKGKKKPKKKKTTAKRKPWAKRKAKKTGRTYRAQKQASTRKKTTAKKKTAAKKKTVAKKRGTAASRRAAALKGARTRKRNAAARSAAAKKSARTRKRGKTVAKRKTTKRKTSTRRTVSRGRKKMTKAHRDAISRGLRRANRRKKMARTVSRRKKKYTKKRTRKYKTRAKKPLGRFKGKKRYVRSGKTRGGRWAKGKMRKRTYAKVNRTRRLKRGSRRTVRQGYNVRKNPLNAIKGMLKEGMYTFGGVLGMRAVTHLIKGQLSTIASLNTGTMGKIAPVLPSALGMLLAALAPKVIKGQPALVKGLQQGATIVFFDTLLSTFLPAGTARNMLLPGAALPVAGYGYGMNEYVGSPLGLEVESAMALDEYVAGPNRQLGMGGDFDVEEALAGGESQSFESGYAGGTLAKTVFANF